MDILLKLLTVGIGGYAVLLAAMFLLQGSMIYFPATGREDERTQADAGLDYETVSLTTEDSIRIEAWYVPAPEARGVVLLTHGNAGNITHWVDYAVLFHRLGYATLMLEYRGYGRSKGKPSEKGTYADARAAWRYLRTERDYPARRIVLVGESLGGAVAARLAAEAQVGALVLASAFTSVPDLAAETYPWIPARQLARYHYDTLTALASVSCPVLIAHSRQDELVRFHHGERLFAAAKEPKTFWNWLAPTMKGFCTAKRRGVSN